MQYLYSNTMQVLCYNTQSLIVAVCLFKDLNLNNELSFIAKVEIFVFKEEIMEQIKALELIIEKIKKDYPNDISVVIMMGSTVFNDTHSRSDLDMFIVPKTQRGFDLGFTCIIDDIGYDFWALGWERLERIANHEEFLTSIITDGKVCYYGSEGDKERWDSLRSKALDYSDRPHILDLAIKELDSAYITLKNQNTSPTLPQARATAIEVVYNLGQALSLLNGIPVRRGRGKLLGELTAMPIIPHDLESRYNTLFYSTDPVEILDTLSSLVNDIHSLVKEAVNHLPPSRSFKENWTQCYEELINYYNKINRACEINDPVTALFAAAELTHEIECTTEHTGVDLSTLPNLVKAYNPHDLSGIGKSAADHKAALESLLADQNVPIRRFKDSTELADFLKDR